MNTITFGVKSINGSHYKLVVCNQTKEFEQGQLCVNSSFIDVWVTKKDINTIATQLKRDGYKEVDTEFGTEAE